MTELFQDDDGQWRFRVKGRNGEKMATSEPYASEANAARGLEDLRAVLRDSAPPRVIGVKQPSGE